VGFEADETNITGFKRTFEREIAQKKVILVEAAVWEASGTLSFRPHHGNSGTGTVAPSASGPVGTVKVSAVTLDDTVVTLGLERVDFIKMDIEGAERHALKGARSTLSRFSPRMAICTYHRSDDREAILDAVLAALPSYKVLNRGRFQSYFY
jgi:FkbM family methyltransferase